MNDYARLLRNNPNFSLLWLAQVVSLTGDWFNTIVLATLVARYSGGSGLAVSLYLMARFLPPLIFGPFAGVLVDRFDRQRILIYSNILRTGVVLLYLLATTPDTLWLIYALTVVQFTLSALFEPGQSAITPSLVGRDDLVLANTLASVTWSVMLALGAVIGGIVGAVFGPAIALIVDAVTFAVAALLIARIRISKAAWNEEQTEEVTGAVASEQGFVDGLRYLVRRPGTAAILLIKAGGSIGNIDTLVTIYATVIFVNQIDSELSLGLMFSSFGVGAILGPLILNRFNDGSVRVMRRLVIIGFIWAVLGWAIMGFARSFVPIIIALVVRAMGGSANWTYSSVIIQKTVPDRFLGRVFSLDMAAFQLATVLSIITHGVLVDILRARATSAWFLNIPEVILPSTIVFPWQTVGMGELAWIAIGTGVASFVPLVLWVLAVLRMESRELGRQVMVPADSTNT